MQIVNQYKYVYLHSSSTKRHIDFMNLCRGFNTDNIVILLWNSYNDSISEERGK